MNTDEYSTEMELYGVELEFIAIIMLFVSLVFPLGFVIEGGILPISLLFAIVFPFQALPFLFLNILYPYWIVRFYQDKTTKDRVFLLGLLSVFFPTVVILSISGLMGAFYVIYPFPIQFITGTIILWKIEKPEVIPTWSGMYPEIYGVNPKLMAQIMILVTLIVPLGYISPGWHSIPLSNLGAIGAYGLLWFLGSGVEFNRGLHFLQPSVMVPTFILSIFNIIFVFQIWKYYQRQTSLRRVLLIGIASLIYPPLLDFMSTVGYVSISMIGIILPIPVQFIIGLILLYKIPGPELVSSSIE
ncbi:MAG: hypothetical protein PVJ05_01445 [Candidatus Thorarchaeota archaeon]|jgi:hypothetical protein